VINEALKEFNALPSTQMSMRDLLKNIYVDESWQVKPDIDTTLLDRTSLEFLALASAAS